MKVTEVRVKLMEDPDDRLQAFCSITFDNSFVVRDVKIIAGTTGPFVAMPSRKLTAHCQGCGFKNHLRASYCNQCGARQTDKQTSSSQGERVKLYADIAHPINSEFREHIQTAIISAFNEEKKLAAEPGYTPRYEDYMDYADLDATSPKTTESEKGSTAPTNPTESKPPTESTKPDSENCRKDQPQTNQPKLDPNNPTQKSTNGPGVDFGRGIL